ncbi:MAG: hypothetical protein HW401_611 [Parcubacteria group bacterium]|nr:hypothetical protein [Parcubacteria group bacterium]
MDRLKSATEKNNFIISVDGSFLPEVISWMFKLKMDFTTIKKRMTASVMLVVLVAEKIILP